MISYFFAEDTVVHEFCALGLSQMAIEFSSKAVIFENNGIEPLVKCLSSTDPDVQKNAIETLAQLLLVCICGIKLSYWFKMVLAPDPLLILATKDNI